jgi:hypothetical protein
MVAQCGQPVVATYVFEQVAEAVAKAGESGGKVLFTPARLPQSINQ